MRKSLKFMALTLPTNKHRGRGLQVPARASAAPEAPVRRPVPGPAAPAGLAVRRGDGGTGAETGAKEAHNF